MPEPTPLIVANKDYADSDRYSRHRSIACWNQERVSGAKIIIAGAGALGNEVIKILSLMGADNLTIVDFDRIELSNLTRSVLFRDSDIGSGKAKTAAMRARELNPNSQAMGIEGDLEFDLGLGVYRQSDIVIGCLDSINARLALNRLCLRAGTPWINGGMELSFGEITLHSSNGACYECGMTDSMWNRRNQRFSCSGQRNSGKYPADAVPTTATVASIVAGYMVNEALLTIHCSDASLSTKPGLEPGQKLLVSLDPYETRTANLTRNSQCIAHEEWSPVILTKSSPSDVSAADIVAQYGEPDDVVELGYDLLTSMTCVSCGSSEIIYMPIEKSDELLTICQDCKSPTRQPAAVSWIDPSSNLGIVSLIELKIVSQQVLALNGSKGRRYFQLTG